MQNCCRLLLSLLFPLCTYLYSISKFLLLTFTVLSLLIHPLRNWLIYHLLLPILQSIYFWLFLLSSVLLYRSRHRIFLHLYRLKLWIQNYNNPDSYVKEYYGIINQEIKQSGITLDQWVTDNIVSKLDLDLTIPTSPLSSPTSDTSSSPSSEVEEEEEEDEPESEESEKESDEEVNVNNHSNKNKTQKVGFNSKPKVEIELEESSEEEASEDTTE